MSTKQNGGSWKNLCLGLIIKNVLSNGCPSLFCTKCLNMKAACTHQLERARWNPGFPGTSIRNGLLTGGRNNNIFSLNFSKSSSTSYDSECMKIHIFELRKK